MFLGVSNYSLRPMQKTYFMILLFFVFITSWCNSQDYEYDENYDYYNENYDYYSQELNDYYGPQNLLAPAAPPPFIPPPAQTPPPPPPPPMDFNSCINNWCYQNGTMGQYTRCKSVSNNGRTCHNPEIKYGSTIGGKPGGVWHVSTQTNFLTVWCRQLFPMETKIYGSARYKVIYLAFLFWKYPKALLSMIYGKIPPLVMIISTISYREKTTRDIFQYQIPVSVYYLNMFVILIISKNT